jgi:hypothetical protein
MHQISISEITMNRRNCIKKISLLSGGLAFSQSSFGKAFRSFEKRKTILLCSGIQYCNIGDIGHVTGILTLLNTYLPEAKVILWPTINIKEFDEIILKYWPDVRIIHSDLINKEGKEGSSVKPDSEEIYQVIEQTDFVIGGHGETAKVDWLAKNYGKPYGVFGVTESSPPSGFRKQFIDNASFYFTRETASLENLKKGNVKCKVFGFAPDATFGSLIQDDQNASRFMREKGLEYKKFICVVPRLRVTPYYRIAPNLRFNPSPWSDEKIREVDALNNKHKEKDHAKARSAMITWINQTGNQVLLCPEMIHNMEIFDELLFDPLPDNIKKKVLKREDFWKTDEAAAIYKNATAVISFECHSPILSYVQGTPAFYLRQPEDTIKGQMYYDIGLSDWVFEIEGTEGANITNRLMDVYNDYPKARNYLESAMDYVRKLQRESMSKIRNAVGLEI